MIKLTYKHIQDPQFNNALYKLVNHPFKDQRFAYNLARILRKYEIELKTCQELYLKLLKQFALLDEKGNFVPQQNIPNTFTIDETKKEEFEKAKAEFMSNEFEIHSYKARIDQLEGVDLTATEMSALDDLIVDMTEVPPKEASEAVAS